MRNNQLLKRRLLWVGAFVIASVVAVTFKLSGYQPSPQAVVVEPIVLETATIEVVNGLNRLFPLLNGTIFEDIPFHQANRTASETDSDGDGFPDWQVYDFGTTEDDGYGGLVKIHDQGSVLKYVFETFQTPTETWSGWLTSPDTDQFPAGQYAWNFSVQTSQGLEQWQGTVTISQQDVEQFSMQGTISKSTSQGTSQLVISDTNPLKVDTTQPALLYDGEAFFTFTDQDGIQWQGSWSVMNVGVTKLWVDENGNGQMDSGEVADIVYDAQTGNWQSSASQSSEPVSPIDW